MKHKITMQKTVLFLLISSLSIFNSYSQKQVETLPESSPCNFISFALPESSYEKPTANRTAFTYYDIDRAKKNANSIINIGISEKTDIDSLFFLFSNYRESLLNDSLKNEKWLGINMKIPQMPLNVFSKILCNLKAKEITYWFLDLRYDELIIFFCNKHNPPYHNLARNFGKQEYAEYLKNADYEALENIEYLTKYRYYVYRLRTVSTEILPTLFESETVVNFYWNNDNMSSQTYIENLDNLISDFKSEFQETIPENGQAFNLRHPNCNRKSFSIHFPANIPLTEIIKIMNISRKHRLICEIDCVGNKLNISTLCYKNERLY